MQEIRSALAGYYKGEIIRRNHVSVEGAEAPTAEHPVKVVILPFIKKYLKDNEWELINQAGELPGQGAEGEDGDSGHR